MITTVLLLNNNASKADLAINSLKEQIPHKLLVLNNSNMYDIDINTLLKKIPEATIKNVQLADHNQILSYLGKTVDTPFFSLISPNISYYKTKLEKSLKYIQKHDSLAIAYSDFDVIKGGNSQRIFLNPYDVRLILSGMPVPMDSVFRTSIFKGLGAKFDIQQLLNIARLIHVPESLYCERQQ